MSAKKMPRDCAESAVVEKHRIAARAQYVLRGCHARSNHVLQIGFIDKKSESCNLQVLMLQTLPAVHALVTDSRERVACSH